MPPKRFYPKMVYQNAKPKTGTLNKRVKKIERVVKHIGRVETKIHDQYGTSNPNALGDLILISDIPQGNTINGRLGNIVTLKSLDLRLYAISLNFGISTIGLYSQRVMIVLDKMGPNTPIVTTILEPISINTGYAPLSFKNQNYQSRFQVLADRTFVLDPLNDTCVNMHIHKRFNIVSESIGASVTFKNQLYLLFINQETNVLAPPLINWQTRLTFTDA